MKKFLVVISVLLILSIEVLSQQLQSPNGKLVMAFALKADGMPTYALTYSGKSVIKPSALGLELKNDEKSLLNDFSIAKTETATNDSN